MQEEKIEFYKEYRQETEMILHILAHIIDENETEENACQLPATEVAGL